MHPSDDIPVVRVDVARRPEDRYDEICSMFGDKMRSLSYLLDTLLQFMISQLLLPRWMAASLQVFIHGIMRGAFRWLSNREETKELRGISEKTGVKMHVLVALNVLLDCMLGCTSGAALVKSEIQVRTTAGPSHIRGGSSSDLVTDVAEDRMNVGRYNLRARKPKKHASEDSSDSDRHLMHFRTLDWGMDPLRELLVEIEYFDSTDAPDHVIARTVTYAGFVGVLTGVRAGLSISLNFKPNHACSNKKFRLHQIATLFGIRPSVSSILRSIIIPESLKAPNKGNAKARDCFHDGRTPLNSMSVRPGDESRFLFHQRAQAIAKLYMPPCYLTLSDGLSVAVIEKDIDTGVVNTASDWSVITNHDVATSPAVTTYPESSATKQIESWLEESGSRRQCIQTMWDKHVASRQRRGKAHDLAISVDELKRWVRMDPIMNECTHFACLMNPITGEISWLERCTKTTEG